MDTEPAANGGSIAGGDTVTIEAAAALREKNADDHVPVVKIAASLLERESDFLQAGILLIRGENQEEPVFPFKVRQLGAERRHDGQKHRRDKESR